MSATYTFPTYQQLLAWAAKRNGVREVMTTAVKNPYAKMVAKPYVENAYEVWTDGTFTTYVLKSYQTDNTKPYARAFCLVTSPMTGQSGDLGDTYWSSIRDGRRIK